MKRLSLFALLFATACRDTVKESGLEETNLPDDDTQTETIDADGDGFGVGEDCDDSDAEVNSGAVEVCDGIDNDCDGLVDDADSPVSGRLNWYQDVDGDGFGNAVVMLASCDQPLGYVSDNTDCNDLDERFYPGADESDCADENDYNCDGSVGFADADGDGYAACEDCDDSVATSNPLGIEVCDGADNNCDGTTDENDAVDASTWYADADADGYGDADTSTEACDAPSGYVADDDDCDDSVADTHPEAVETCDGTDNDCDGLVDSDDPDVSGTTVFYADADADGHGGQQFPVSACEAPSGYVESSDDCDDLDAASYPGAAEICDDADNDCDSDVDEGVGTTWYEDSDSDGYGNGSVSVVTCAAPSGYVSNALDCDDFTSTTNPGSYEICDSVDNDCDGVVDEDAINATVFYLDVDGDGYGSASSSITACASSTGYADNAGDCNDNDSAVNPTATELCDSVDNDCDGSTDEDDAADGTTWYPDLDLDGFGSASGAVSACTQPTGYVVDATDCDDTNASANTSVTEVCDSVDNDCDGDVDEDDATDAQSWYTDTDSDGYGTGAAVLACTQPAAHVDNSQDCNDADGAVSPGATEVCDGIDNNCSGLVDDSVSGSSAQCPGDSCQAILDEGASTGDGVYWIDPGAGSGAYEVYCDMTIDGGGWTMLLNLDTSDGHVMWWANDLWTNTSTHGDVSTPLGGDHKSQAYMELGAGSRILLVVHEQGSVVGWKSFNKSGGDTLATYMAAGDNNLMTTSVQSSDTSSVWTGERLVLDSTALFANHCVNEGSGCVSSNGGGSSDGDRIASDESTPSGNSGGGLGNWHDMRYCCGGNSYAGHGCNGSAFRTTSEAQAGWSYSGQNGTFGSDSVGAMTGAESNSGCSNANWVIANGMDYDYAVFFGQ